MANVGEPASVLYPPALAEVIGCVNVPDKPRVRGGVLVTFRDERGTLVTIRLLRPAAVRLLRALQSGSVDVPARLRALHSDRMLDDREFVPIIDLTATCLATDQLEVQAEHSLGIELMRVDRPTSD